MLKWIPRLSSMRPKDNIKQRYQISMSRKFDKKDKSCQSPVRRVG